MSRVTCEDHDGVVVIYEKTGACPLCEAQRRVQDLEDDLDVAAETNARLEDAVDSMWDGDDRPHEL